MLLEQLDDQLVSLGEDPSLLLDFKQFAGLPTEPTWTKADRLLKGRLDSAEKMVDHLTGYPYRIRSFKASYECFQRITVGRQTYYGLELTRRSLQSDPTIAWTDTNGATGTYTVADFSVVGAKHLKPLIIFPFSYSPPDFSDVPFPLVVTFTAGSNSKEAVALTAIFELATFYYRFPEAANGSELPMTNVFTAHLDYLRNSFL